MLLGQDQEGRGAEQFVEGEIGRKAGNAPPYEPAEQPSVA